MSEGIRHLVENIARLHHAAGTISDAGDHTSAAILGSVATEEAAKVLILLDAVCCPRTEPEARSATFRHWNDHLWKGLYATACSWPGDTFGDVEKLVEAESKLFYLDGPIGVDWLLPNAILTEREQRMYVDYVRDITPGSGDPPWWSPPSISHSAYEASDCVVIVDAMQSVGLFTIGGLGAVAATWRSFRPDSGTSRDELRALVSATVWDMMWLGIPEFDNADAAAIDYINATWPFPLWSIPNTEKSDKARKAQRTTSLAEREQALDDIRKIEGVREPRLAISEDAVMELHKAYVVYRDDRRSHEDRFAERSPGGGWRIIPAGIPAYGEDAPPYRKLKDLWRALSHDERVALAALAVFTRGRVANWTSSHHQATTVVDRNDERYNVNLGGEWLNGLRRYQGDPPQRH